ncbi:tetratricopeptide repeat protein [Nostoc sp.]|uniref:tetratricopeptide repeat protein n=1 Tax=Nostoc sp. TaxID=1180 RepID=UPI002FF696DC
MMGSAKSQWVFWCFLTKFTRNSLTLLLSMVLLSDAVGATPRNRGLQIAQQPGTTSQNATRAAAKRVYQEALPIYRAVGDRAGEANSPDSNRAAAEKAEAEAGQLSKQNAPLLSQVIPKWEEALKYWRLAKDRKREAKALDHIAKLYLVRGEYPKALEYAQEALPICQALGDRDCEGAATGSLSLIYKQMGEYQKAIDMSLKLPSLFPETLDLPPTVFSTIGQIYSQNLGEKQKALDYYNKALNFWKKKGDVVKQAEKLDEIAIVYSNYFGEINKSFDYITQANNLDPEFKRDRTIFNLSYLSLQTSSCSDKLALIKKPPKIEQSKNSSNQSASANSNAATNNIEEWKQTGQKWHRREIIRAEVEFLEMLGGLGYGRIGEYEKALEVYKQALKMRQMMGGKPDEANTLK